VRGSRKGFRSCVRLGHPEVDEIGHRRCSRQHAPLATAPRSPARGGFATCRDGVKPLYAAIFRGVIHGAMRHPETDENWGAPCVARLSGARPNGRATRHLGGPERGKAEGRPAVSNAAPPGALRGLHGDGGAMPRRAETLRGLPMYSAARLRRPAVWTPGLPCAAQPVLSGRASCRLNGVTRRASPAVPHVHSRGRLCHTR